MPWARIPPLPLERGASSFAINLLLSTGFTETMRILEDIRIEGQQLLAEYRQSEGSRKADLKTAISAGIQDRNFLLQTLFMHVLEKDV